jgi:cyclic pyranopterin phosphate synthase
MKMSYLPLDDALRLAESWRAAGGRPDVELAALEPTLWHEGNLDVANMARELANSGLAVSMTTNGSRLARMAPRLAQSGLTRLRVSWHTLDPARFRALTATGDYRQFLAGIHAALGAKLPLSINRVLIAGLCDDLPEHVAFVDRYRLRMKLLDLYETSDNARERNSHYVAPMAVIRPLIESGTLREFFVEGDDGRRGRRRFRTEHGGIVEIKVSSSARNEDGPCTACAHRCQCLEGLADYFRVTPDLRGNFCYRRGELGFSLRAVLESDHPAEVLQETIQAHLGVDPKPLLTRAALRYIVTSGCNFNCGFPGSTTSWCLKQGQEFLFPPRRPEVVQLTEQVMPYLEAA